MDKQDYNLHKSSINYFYLKHFIFWGGIRQTAISRLQLVQNAATRLLSGVKKREHITPNLRSLHWLPVCIRVNLKCCSLFINLEMVWPLPISVSYWLSINRLDPFGHPTRIYCLPLRWGLSAGEIVRFVLLPLGFGTPCHSPLDKLLLLIFLSPG